MQLWRAHYRDAQHDGEITIVNREADCPEPLSFALDGVSFRGGSLEDFRLEDGVRLEEAAGKFSILRQRGVQEGVPWVYGLQGYGLEVWIPVGVLRREPSSLAEGTLYLAFEKPAGGGTAVGEFSLFVDGLCCQSARKTLCFELALADISRQLRKAYVLQCCFTCQYADYSPYGSADYGGMLCFRRHKDDCLKVDSKDSFFALLDGKDFDFRQETSVCGQYRLRNLAGGYRGFLDGGGV